MAPPPMDLTGEQQAYLLRLYQTYQRDIIEVKPSQSQSAKVVVPSHTYRFVQRLHAFLTAFLRGALDDDGTNDVAFVKKPGQSCLKSFARLALNKVDKDEAAAQAEEPTKSMIRLRCGRRVLRLHHPEFLEELNHFELQGQTASSEFIRRDSYGAFLYHVPEQALAALGCAMALSVVSLYRSYQEATSSSICEHYVDATQIIVRFAHIQPQVAMMDLKTGLVGKLLTVQGHVVKARHKQLRVATADFCCLTCSAITTHALDHGRYSVPTKCFGGNKCKSRSFALLRSTARYIDVQHVRLQEAQDESTLHAGRTPRQMVLELPQDLVHACRPGDSVLVAAIVAAVNTAAGQRGKHAQETSTFSLYLQGHSVTTLSERTTTAAAKSGSASSSLQQQFVYTPQQLQTITHLCHADHRYFGLTERRAFPFDLLVRSLCPSIIGHDTVKAGLLLCLLGGTPSSNNSQLRSNSHILIVGDPGMGKSQMLLGASQLATRSVFVGGNTSSTTGLTVTLTREDGQQGMEAGALVLADQGICCIDEFDKMTKNHQDGLLEAMEQQQVSIAKAGVVASLPARCSVIAAANPRHGSYNMSKSVSENLNMAKPILSRFDLVFILRDRADKEQDRLVSSNIMNLYRGNGTAPVTQTNNKRDAQQMTNTTGETEPARLSLSDRLAWVTDFQKQPLPADLVRDYIAYAREYCKPKMTPEAAQVLKEYFMNLRYPADGQRKRDTVPITTRQLEALIRLCQARAKACLRDFVLNEDALDVVELMSRSVDQVHSDELGHVDPSRGGAGGKSNRKMKKAFVAELHRIVGIGAECTLNDLRRVADKVGCGLNEFAPTVEDLRNNGTLMKKSSGNYQVL